MNGFLLLIPFLLIRFNLLSKLSKDGIRRAAHFPSMQGNGILVYWIYQISNVVLFIYLFFLNVTFTATWIFILGIFLYILGLITGAISVMDFAKPKKSGLNNSGIYKFSRNPMYVSYFMIFVGCSLLTKSIPLFIIVLIFQISAHGIILAEEKWCVAEFGNDYLNYMSNVRRYI
ncbi:isoprenylcysteine carboxylmethyltransferase family protein [Anaerorhabdus sp.]|uniref:methyltransferase family protein n=1 Tax=Anaerorhabdus sp. TaxID=1872524 RepID=UPI002B21AFFD|nr:isoprenylcysteine carboxylmethyltransferase family protein [Anaerorhabdus sp.]MEA4875854.1 isoprenylcysteine carboxylmethyltransferase family protein [Anaerorhabdus sp.]